MPLKMLCQSQFPFFRRTVRSLLSRRDTIISRDIDIDVDIYIYIDIDIDIDVDIVCK